jgi:endonuclease III
MQRQFDFLAVDIERWRGRLAPMLKGVEMLPRRRPIGQLVKSIMSSRTRDAVSQAAFDRLTRHYCTVGRLAASKPKAVEAIISDVTHAPAKAEWLVAALARIRHEYGGFDLGFMGEMPLADSLACLERLDGVRRKVAASTLNASTLGLPVLIVDTHVLRVLRRLSAISPTASYREASDAVTGAMADWTGDDFLLFHVAMKRLGQAFCHDRAPNCRACPLAADCPTAKAH